MFSTLATVLIFLIYYFYVVKYPPGILNPCRNIEDFDAIKLANIELRDSAKRSKHGYVIGIFPLDELEISNLTSEVGRSQEFNTKDVYFRSKVDSVNVVKVRIYDDCDIEWVRI